MTRFVIDAATALTLARMDARISPQHSLLAPTVLRSQVLTILYAAVQRGECDKATADQQLDYLRALKIRLLGDRVLQRRAWQIAAHCGWADTFAAEYVALAQLQADALVTDDPALAAALQGIVTVAPIGMLWADPPD